MDRSIYYLRGNKIRFLLGLFVIIFFIMVIAAFINSNSGTTTVAVKGQNIQVELAETDQEKQIGLSQTQSLNDDEGMLFIFNNPDFYPFWMKDMKFPIDIIFINGDKVVTLFKNVQPPSDENAELTVYRPTERADKVLEVNAGYADEHDIQEGTIIDINNL